MQAVTGLARLFIQYHDFPNIFNMPQAGTCCTCASFLSDTKVPRDPKSEKPLTFDRHLECCPRIICAACQYKNPRFQTYCPFCQISSEPTALPQNGLRLPPAYSKTATAKSNGRHAEETSLRTQLAGIGQDEAPPPYTPSSTASVQNTLSSPYTAQAHHASSISSDDASTQSSSSDTIHHLSPSDTLTSLSLAYKVPIPILQSHNNLFASNLLAGRKILLIPASHYQGPPLSTPPDPAEEARKRRIRRWMVATKCADYRVAEVYLKGVTSSTMSGSEAGLESERSPNGDIEGREEEDQGLKEAIERFKADEEWERRNPLQDKKGKMGARRRVGGGGSLSGQLF